MRRWYIAGKPHRAGGRETKQTCDAVFFPHLTRYRELRKGDKRKLIKERH